MVAVVTLLILSLQTDARPHFEAGVRAQRAGQCPAAISSYREAITAAPNLAPAHYLLGVCLLQTNDIPAGIAALESSLRLDPKNANAAQTLVSAYVATGLLDHAQRILTKHLATDRSPGAQFTKGLHALSTAQYPKAVQHFTQARKLNPQLPSVATHLGIAHAFNNNFEAAFPILEAANKANPQDTNAAAFLGWLLKDRGRDNEAEPLLRQALLANPQDTGALFLLAQLSISRNNPREALTQLEQVVQRDPNHRGAWVLLTRLYTQQNRPTEAAQAKATVDRLNALLHTGRIARQ
jgi:tetratricopeptide (TPR) repeat protein